MTNKVNAIALTSGDLFEYMADRLGNDKDYTVLFNLYDRDNKSLQDSVNMNDIDLVIVEFSLFAGTGDENNLSAIYAGKAQNKDGFPPDYLMIFNNENVDELLRFNDILLKMKICITSIGLNDEADKILVAQNVRGVIKRRIKEKERFADMDTVFRKISEF